MDRPSTLSIPSLHAGNTALISWSEVIGANTYQLDRKINNEASFSPIYSGPNVYYTDYLPENATTATYRVQAAAERDQDWDELDALDRDFDELDSLDWMWFLDYSDFTTAETREAIPNRPPVVSGQDSDIGTRYRGFEIIFSATDPDPNNIISLVVRLNGNLLFNMPNAQQGANYTVNVTDAQIFAMEDQSRHSIIITATDNKGASAIRTYTFTAVEDLVTTAVFYVLRDGSPVAKLTSIQQWTDYLEVGTHRYVIRGVDRYDNFSDSNEVSITISLNHATLALASSPGNYIDLIVRRNERPQVGQNYNMVYTETHYEGRDFPVFEYSSQRRNSVPLGFSTRTLAEQATLFSMISHGVPVVYRDLYDSRIVGVIPELANSNQGRFRGQAYNAFIDFNITINQCDFNEVIPYD